MIVIKHIKLEPAEGGYIIKYDCYEPNVDTYDGLKHIGEKKVVLEDGKDAIAKVDELYEMSMEKNPFYYKSEKEDDEEIIVSEIYKK